MQILTRAILTLYLAHLLTDFPFQSAILVEEKKSARVGGYLKHGAIYFIASIVIVGLFIRGSATSLHLYAVVFCLTLVHLGIDGGKIALTKAGLIADSAWGFVFDQSLHLLTVITAAWWFVQAPPIDDLIAALANFRESRNRVLLLTVIYVAVIFAGGYLIRYLTKPLMLDKAESSEDAKQLRNAGLYIGWLERFLVLTAILLQSPATVGLILTAKSIARYPELKSVRFAEYFLIGTLLSICLAILGGIVLLKAFTAQFFW
jgi:hypothetical protein